MSHAFDTPLGLAQRPKKLTQRAQLLFIKYQAYNSLTTCAIILGFITLNSLIFYVDESTELQRIRNSRPDAGTSSVIASLLGSITSVQHLYTIICAVILILTCLTLWPLIGTESFRRCLTPLANRLRKKTLGEPKEVPLSKSAPFVVAALTLFFNAFISILCGLVLLEFHVYHYADSLRLVSSILVISSAPILCLVGWLVIGRQMLALSKQEQREMQP